MSYAATPPHQWIRKWSLLIQQGEQVLDLSSMQLRFRTEQSDATVPNTCTVRVFNLSAATVSRIYSLSNPLVPGTTGPEYAQVIVQAGYQTGNFGVVFIGTIKQLRNGKESSTDTFLDIFAADWDLFYNFGFVSQSLSGPLPPSEQLNSIMRSGSAASGQNITPPDAQITGGVLPRGKVLYGMARDHMADLAATSGARLFVQNGVLQAMPVTGYLPGEIVVINSHTGMVGIPEATQNGIEVMCLLNPKITLGGRIQLNNKDINKTRVTNRGIAGPLNDTQLYASESNYGIYRVMVHEMEGDTRGNPWYSRLTCLDIDQSAPADSCVLEYP